MTDSINVKEKIVNLLREEGLLASSFISNYLRINYYRTLSILRELEEEGIIVSERKPRGIIWRLK